MFTTAFWKAALERAIKSAAQFALVGLGQDVVSVDLFNADFDNIAGLAAGGFVVSILTSLISIPLSSGSSPSLVPAAEVEAAQTPG